MSKIEWTDATWNPTTGCTKISAGCKNCYAARMAKRLHAMGQEKYRNEFRLTLHRDELSTPFGWKKPRMAFVNSMSDLFHDHVPDTFIQAVFEVMGKCPHHTFQVLTKRPERARALASRLDWSLNVWMGTSVENDSVLHRVSELRVVPPIRFLSIEPLLGPLEGLDLSGIQWVIVGGESGPGARPMEADWVRPIRDQCVKRRVPFFFKQWGGTNKKLTGRLLDGRTWDEMPGKG